MSGKNGQDVLTLAMRRVRDALEVMMACRCAGVVGKCEHWNGVKEAFAALEALDAPAYCWRDLRECEDEARCGCCGAG